ncbi:MAG TPA: hypothetical protein VMB75_02760 [Rhodocyclaceae bacterium]|nr:hypothetical protein [Rhodocyclaceae bacterium]
MTSHASPIRFECAPTAVAAGGRSLAAPVPAYWHRIQDVLLAAGVLLVVTLLLWPAVGLSLMWNGLIPLAPALLVVAPGLWRNVCPMASVSQLARRWGLSWEAVLPRQASHLLAALALAALLIIVPLRHLSLDTDGPMTALMLVLSALIAFAMGMAYQGRSGWCNSLCPIHPAEKLYGQMPALTLANARCQDCRQCAVPCPDSTRSMSPAVSGPTRLERAVGHLMIGGFVGFVWGWYRLPDFAGPVGADEIAAAYLWPFGCGLGTLAIYAAAYHGLYRSRAERRLLARLFAAAAVATYYWYRIPALTGFGPHPGSGMLVDLTASLPALPLVSHLVTTAFFAWFLLLRQDPRASWLRRPPIPER